MEMKRFFSTIFLTVVFALTALGQADDEHVIKGTVVDENNEPVPFANAALYNRADSALVTGAVSTAEGTFRIPVGPGQYYLKITFLSYEEKTIPRVDVTAGDVDLGTITLRPGQRLLEEVTVQSERSSME